MGGVGRTHFRVYSNQLETSREADFLRNLCFKEEDLFSTFQRSVNIHVRGGKVNLKCAWLSSIS